MATTTTNEPLPVEATLMSVISRDGTRIGAHVSGAGRPLVLLHGTSSDSSAWRHVAASLGSRAQVYRMDRRGRGTSGDARTYSIESEYDDATALVESAAAVFGGPVDLLGHSYGGNVAFGAATRTTSIRRLVLYEGWPPPNPGHRSYPAGLHERLAALAATDRERMLEVFLRECAGLTDAELDMVRQASSWPARVAAAPTVPREVRAFGDCAFDPSVAAAITAPTLLLVGSESPHEVRADPEIVAAALPGACVRELHGQAHMAHLTAPDDFVAAVLDFLRE